MMVKFCTRNLLKFCGALTKIILFREFRDPPVNLFSENSL
jgi:hypothetical protein